MAAFLCSVKQIALRYTLCVNRKEGLQAGKITFLEHMKIKCAKMDPLGKSPGVEYIKRCKCLMMNQPSCIHVN